MIIKKVSSYIRKLIIKNLYVPYSRYRLKQIRKKDKIKILFIIAELGAWKTESLYKRMLSHDRFEPILGVTTSIEVPGSKDSLINYIKSNGYSFVDLDVESNSISKINPDIKFYYKPYVGSYRNGLFFDKNLKSIVCHINYAFNSGGDYESYRHSIRRHSVLCFAENNCVVETIKSIPGLYSKNNVVTGVPMQDSLLIDKSECVDPWKKQGDRKRIIYAPHHSIPGTNGAYIEYSTFLLFGEFMLDLAKKYNSQVQWAFKPHPTLYKKLVNIWGQSKTDLYYSEWENMENSQLELGEYVGLFKYSDAMIHDCSSFTIEYLFTQNPVMFLQIDKTQTEQHQGKFAREAYFSHYIGNTKQEIEDFVVNVINGVDTMKKRRLEFMNNYLLPPNNRTACDNIIDAILGNGIYKNII